MNLPFGVVAIGLVIRGFTGYFLERAGVFDSFVVPAFEVGPIAVEGFAVSIWGRLVVYVAAGVLVSLVGVLFTSRMADGEGPLEEVPE
jgi:putative membrane protein